MVTLSSFSVCMFLLVNNHYYCCVIWTYVRPKTVMRVDLYLLLFEQKMMLIYCWWMSYLLEVAKRHRVYSQKSNSRNTLSCLSYRIDLNTISVISVESNSY